MKRPKPPDHLSEDALLEWHRVVDELADADRLDKADRAAITLYVETWDTYCKMMVHVRQHGAVVAFSNGVAGQSPQYKTARECANYLRQLLADLGLTPMTRSKISPAKKEAEPEGLPAF